MDVDVAVVGAGFGGMAAALELGAAGARVALFEALRYPGGCASTFTRGGCQFEAGATLFSGFGPGQLFEQWRERFGLLVPLAQPDPVVELRAPGFSLAIPPSRELLVERLAALAGPDAAALRRFFSLQERVASVLWSLFDRPDLLPPFGLAALLEHARRSPAYTSLLPLLGRPLGAVLRSFGVAHLRPLRCYLDAVCQITVQCSAEEAEAPLALAAMDYYFRGTRHVRGGVGTLAWGLLGAAQRQGVEAHLAERVQRLEREGEGWLLRTSGRELRARAVVANVLPQALLALTEQPRSAHPALDAMARAVESGWGAVMLYLLVREGASPREEAHHLELVRDAEAPFRDGNHLFCSLSGADELGRAPAGHRTVTVSTHVALSSLRGSSPEQRAERVSALQEQMRRTLRERAPELAAAVVRELTASPRTFERFTRRPEGLVGGVPRRASLAHYRSLAPAPAMPGLYLVGDSVFPGQSTLAVALGGKKTAEALLRSPLLRRSSTLRGAADYHGP